MEDIHHKVEDFHTIHGTHSMHLLKREGETGLLARALGRGGGKE